jgi:hypothetical protein
MDEHWSHFKPWKESTEWDIMTSPPLYTLVIQFMAEQREIIIV